MATPRVSDDSDVQAHYAAQAGLGALLIARIRAVWGRLSGVPDEMIVDVVEALTTQFGSAAISLSADFYEDMRAKAGVPDDFRTPVIDPPSRSWVESSVEWALDVPDTVEVEPEETTDSGEAAGSGVTFEDDADVVSTETEVVEDPRQARVERAAEKMVSDVGRNELIEAIESDKQARGWARVTRPGACAFCLMLATRGAKYKSERTAGRNANVRFTGEGEFKFHNNCHCTVVPLFADVYEPPAHIRAAKALWADTGDLNSFRRALYAERKSEG